MGCVVVRCCAVYKCSCVSQRLQECECVWVRKTCSITLLHVLKSHHTGDTVHMHTCRLYAGLSKRKVVKMKTDNRGQSLVGAKISVEMAASSISGSGLAFSGHHIQLESLWVNNCFASCTFEQDRWQELKTERQNNATFQKERKILCDVNVRLTAWLLTVFWPLSNINMRRF